MFILPDLPFSAGSMEPNFKDILPALQGHVGNILENIRELLQNSFLIGDKKMNPGILDKVLQECGNDKMYHRFMVYADKEYRRDMILRTLLNFVQPATFKPVLFNKEENNCFFFAKSCQNVLLKLVTSEFKVPIPNTEEKFLRLEVMCNFISAEALEVSYKNNLAEVLRTRYDAVKRSFDLSRFCDDESLLEYCPLYLAQNMLNVMAQVGLSNPININLQHNHLKDMSTFYSLQKSLQTLDLRNNEIQSLKDLECLKHFEQLRSLYLDGNPLCALYNDFNYVMEIRSLRPTLAIIDGRNATFPPKFRQNYLRCLESQEFADQFMTQFFTGYDSDNRQALEGLYDKNALFSVTAKVVPDQDNSNDIDLTRYGLTDPYLVYGADEIMKLFQELPKTLHDRYTLSCDVTLYEPTCAAVSISGIYIEHKQLISFLRYFVLNRSGDKFTITNEQLTVTNATKSQSERSFTICGDSHFPFERGEYKKFEVAFGKLTKMNKAFCQKFLYHTHYDLNKALQVFCEAYSDNRIHPAAFVTDRNTSNDDRFAFSDLIIENMSKPSQTLSKRFVWKTFEMERVKEYVRYEEVKNLSVKKIFHMRHIQTNASPEPSVSDSRLSPEPMDLEESDEENNGNIISIGCNLSEIPIVLNEMTQTNELGVKNEDPTNLECMSMALSPAFTTPSSLQAIAPLRQPPDPDLVALGDTIRELGTKQAWEDPEIRARLAALRKPGNVKRLRLRIPTSDGTGIRVHIPKS